MQKLFLIALTSAVLTGCATHKPAPKPTGTLFKINEQSLIQPTPIQMEIKNG